MFPLKRGWSQRHRVLQASTAAPAGRTIVASNGTMSSEATPRKKSPRRTMAVPPQGDVRQLLRIVVHGKAGAVDPAVDHAFRNGWVAGGAAPGPHSARRPPERAGRRRGGRRRPRSRRRRSGRGPTHRRPEVRLRSRPRWAPPSRWPTSLIRPSTRSPLRGPHVSYKCALVGLGREWPARVIFGLVTKDYAELVTGELHLPPPDATRLDDSPLPPRQR